MTNTKTLNELIAHFKAITEPTTGADGWDVIWGAIGDWDCQGSDIVIDLAMWHDATAWNWVMENADYTFDLAANTVVAIKNDCAMALIDGTVYSLKSDK